MRVRKHYSRLSDRERQAFVQALLTLKDDGRYDRHVRIYSLATCWARRGPAFLPWHRHLLLRFEEDLRSVDPEVTLPYWDFCRDRSTQSPLWDEDFMGGDGRPHDGMVIDGPFATEAGAWPLVGGGVLVRRLGRDPVASNLPTVEDLEHALLDPSYDVAPWDPSAPSGLRNRLEGWVRGPALHNRVHAWVGGVMARNDAPDDPLFWLVHAFIDRSWAEWQQRHPAAEYLPRGEGPPGHNFDDALWPWNGGDAPEVIEPFGESPSTIRPRDLLDHRVLGYAYDTDPGGDGIRVTTYAIGEEQPTFGFGEDVPAPAPAAATEPGGAMTPATTERVGARRPRMTTRMRGEEDPRPTTLAVGEESPTTRMRGEEGPRPTTRMRGEEGPTTMAVGEEGRVGAPDPHRMTTFAIGEEEPSSLDDIEIPPPPHDPHRMTTFAVGEEEPRSPEIVEDPSSASPPEDADVPPPEAPPGATTEAIGEEEPTFTTLAVGEEGPPPFTTQAIGEEGPPSITTYAIGEEGPPPFTTQAIGEENPPPFTTQAIGEEGPPSFTTYAVGEESPPPFTTQAIGEEGPPSFTTQTIGEEGPAPSTAALGEEGPVMTTLAIGEEQPAPWTQTAGEDDGPTGGGGGPFGTY